MIRIFKHYIPKSLFILGLGECFILLGAIWGGLNFRFIQAGLTPPSFTYFSLEIFSFVFLVYIVIPIFSSGIKLVNAMIICF